MQYVGDLLSDEQRMAVVFPYSDNHGEEWNLSTVAIMVEEGFKQIQEDKELFKSFEDAASLLKNRNVRA